MAYWCPTVSWGKLLRSRSVWALGLQWFCHYDGFYFYITWLPMYLYQVRGLDLRHGSLAAGFRSSPQGWEACSPAGRFRG